MTYIKLKKKKIAIIGGGISGLSAAYLLSNDYDISLYESKSMLGGHAITLGKIMPDHNGKLKKFFFDMKYGKTPKPDPMSKSLFFLDMPSVLSTKLLILFTLKKLSDFLFGNFFIFRKFLFKFPE